MNISIFKIEDKTHAELQSGEYQSFEQALNELIVRSKIPWDKNPNRCPCTKWKTCKRDYQIIEYDAISIPWKEIDRQDILTISANRIQ